jgi:hypothetical protein
MKIRIERLCGWHGIEYKKPGYLSLGYWLVRIGDKAR